MRDLKLTGQLLDIACQALTSEMEEFALVEFLEDMWNPLEKEGLVGDEEWSDPIKALQGYQRGTYEWPQGKTWRDYAVDIKTAQQALQGRPDLEPKFQFRAKEDERLLGTVDWLAKSFRQKIDTARKPPGQPRASATPLETQMETLARKATLLHEFTEMWNIYQIAWEQHHQEASWDPAIEEGLTLRTIQAADRVVRGLYQVVEEQKLDLIMPHQLLIIVPFGGGLHALGSATPTPYVISPYWGHRQVWTWLGYAHEVGHHVYRNVEGLSNELKVNVAMELWKQGQSHDVQSIWFNWLEEVFADLFGLLQIGPAFAHTQLLMLPHLPIPAARRQVGHRLLAATDETHPIAYLRVFLAIETLKKLKAPPSDIKQLEKKWKALLQGVDASTVHPLVRGRSVELPIKDMEKVATIVLDVILDADLDALALADKSMPSPAPRSLRAVFSEPLDENKVKATQQAIATGLFAGEFDMRHLLVAMQKSLEELSEQTGGEPSAETIDDLSQRVIDALMAPKVYEEAPLPML
jgi:hypothetical protein